MSKFKIAIVGVGGIGHVHLRSYLKNENVEVYAICDLNEKRLNYIGDKYGITRRYKDEAQMLAELPEIDGVSVCTWNSAHAPCTIMALNAGKHVLCEKPMATTVEDAIAMKEAADRNGKLLMIGFVRRFGDDCLFVEDMLKENELGEVYYAKTLNIRRHGNPGGWFGDKSRSGGGPLIDLGVHSIDLVRYLIGKPKAISVYGCTFDKLGLRKDIKTPKAYVASSSTENDFCDCEDLANAMIRFDNGIVLSLEMSFALNTSDESNSVQLFGTKAGVKLGDDITMSTVQNGYLADVKFPGMKGMNLDMAFEREMRNFVESAQGLCECKNSAEDGIELMRILTAIYRSAESGHEEIL